MELRDFIFFPETMAGVEIEMTTQTVWRQRLLEVARTPFIGVLTSIAASLLALIQSIWMVVITPIALVAGLVGGKRGGGSIMIGAVLGLSIFTQAVCIVNIATLGFLCYRAEFKLDATL